MTATAPAVGSAPTIDPGALPTRPRLAPGRVAVWRSPTCLQIGLRPDRALVVDGLTAALAAALRRLDGVRTTAELLAEVVDAGGTVADAVALLTELRDAHLLVDAAAGGGRAAGRAVAPGSEAAAWSVHGSHGPGELLRRRRDAVVHVVGGGRVSVGVACTLAAAGAGRVVVLAAGPVRADDLGTGYLPTDVGRSRAAAAADAVARATVPAAGPEGGAAPAAPDLVVLGDAVGVDPAVAADLVAARVPHLRVCATEGVAVVGPLVLPGRSSCLRCADLHAADVDAVWPKLAAQLVDVEPESDLAGAHLAVALGVQQALAVLAGPDAGVAVPPTWNAVLEVDGVRGDLRRRARPPHARCGCGAAGWAAPVKAPA